jgi:hypothetical protein
MLELGGFRLEVYIGPNFNIRASNFNIKAYTNSSQNPPTSTWFFSVVSRAIVLKN